MLPWIRVSMMCPIPALMILDPRFHLLVKTRILVFYRPTLLTVENQDSLLVVPVRLILVYCEFIPSSLKQNAS
jgi:hypothetical protein